MIRPGEEIVLATSPRDERIEEEKFDFSGGLFILRTFELEAMFQSSVNTG